MAVFGLVVSRPSLRAEVVLSVQRNVKEAGLSMPTGANYRAREGVCNRDLARMSFANWETVAVVEAAVS